MTLKAYLAREKKRRRLGLVEFGDAIGVTHPTVIAIREGADPRLSVARAIVLATDGHVSYEDLYRATQRAR